MADHLGKYPQKLNYQEPKESNFEFLSVLMLQVYAVAERAEKCHLRATLTTIVEDAQSWLQ